MTMSCLTYQKELCKKYGSAGEPELYGGHNVDEASEDEMVRTRGE